MTFELTNIQRKYFGLIQVDNSWDKQLLSDKIIAYFDKEKVVKIISYAYAYLEYDTDIDTKDRKFIIPKSNKGKEQKLSIAKLLKIKGCGIQFSISFFGGGITVFDNKRNVIFIKSTFEDGEIKNFDDADRWIQQFIDNSSLDYLDILKKQLSKKRIIQDTKPGDIISFKVGRNEYGFARILKGISKKKGFELSNFIINHRIHPRSLTVAPYAYISDNTIVNLDDLISKPTLPSLYIFDSEVYYGEMPILGHRPLTENELEISPPQNVSTFVTIFYTKTDILKFINTGKL